MGLETGSLVKVKDIKMPYANEIGTITGFVKQGANRPRLLVLRLDHGYQAPKVGYKDIRYSAVIEETLVLQVPAETPRSFTKRLCDICLKPCFSNLTPLIAHEINGQTVCEHCAKKVIFDTEKITFVSVAEEIEQRKRDKPVRERQKKC